MQPTLLRRLVFPPPATGPFGLAWLDGPRAGGAADGRVALIVQLVLRDVVGLYVVEDLLGRGGAQFAYRIEVKPYEPGFTLSVSADKLDVPKTGVASITVQIARRDYNGPVALKVEGLPEGFTASPSVIGPGQKQAFLTVTATGPVPEGQALMARITGTAEINGKQVVQRADASGPLGQALSDMKWPPQMLASVVAVGVAPEPVYPPWDTGP